MESNPLRERGLASEEAYVRQIETERLRRLRVTSARERLRAELGAELGIEDDALLARLIELGITPDTAPAFEALPLVEVAWADGEVDAEERWRVLTGATAFGLELGRPAHAQLELWLTRRPNQELFEAWYAFAAEVLALPESAQRARRVLEGARDVAMATGGLLGGGRVSRAERAVIGRINQALANAPGPADKS